MKFSAIKLAIVGMTMIMIMSTQVVMASDYEQHWAKEAIEKWNQYEIVKGYENGDFKPNSPITRAELACILDRIFQFSKVEATQKYEDLVASSNKWYIEPVDKVSSLNLMYIEGTRFEPEKFVTREEAAYAIANAYELVQDAPAEDSFIDKEKISIWAKKAVDSLAEKGYIVGTPKGEFMPQSPLTRAEVIAMIDHMTRELITSPGEYSQSIDGNVIINSSDVILKDLTVDGNLYITQNVKQTTLENITVTGTTYVNGGSLQLSGTYENVHLCSGEAVDFISGSIKNLEVNKAGSIITVQKDATLNNVVQNQPIIIKSLEKLEDPLNPEFPGEPEIPGKPGEQEELKLQAVGVYINNQYVALPVSDTMVSIDVPSLSAQFDRKDRIDGLKILANTPDATIKSDRGSIKTGEVYTLLQLEGEMGLIREVAQKNRN